MSSKTKLAQLGTRRDELRRQLAEVEGQLHDAIRAALADGCRPGEVVELSSYSPAQVRNVARAAGLPPARRGAGRAD